MKDMMVLWISMSACVPTYMMASGMIKEGMSWWQAVATIFLANLIVLVPMVLNAHAGTRYGIPFPVYCRASFGILGANVPALLRALVACGWFGIQTWIGGWAIYKILTVHFQDWEQLAKLPFLGINAAQFACFLFFWSINMLVIYRGIESIRILLNIKAPVLIALGLALLAWAYYAANGFGPMLSKPSDFAVGGPKAGQFWSYFFISLTGNVGFWATLSLNIPDFSRYAYSQRDQVWGQALGLPTTMALFSFIGVAVTSATAVIYGAPEWDPVVVLSKFTNPFVLVIAMVSLCVATLATNIAANVVSPANDFAHLWPSAISFRIGGFITGLIGILMQPWRLVADPSRYFEQWLIAYSALLGRGWRHSHWRLFCDPPHAARFAWPVPEERPVLVFGRVQSDRPAGTRAGRYPVRPRFLGHRFCDVGRAHSARLDRDLPLRLVHQLWDLLRRLCNTDDHARC